MIFVTHSIEEAVYLSDQIVLLTPAAGDGPPGRPAERGARPAEPGRDPPRQGLSRRGRRDLAGARSAMWGEAPRRSAAGSLPAPDRSPRWRSGASLWEAVGRAGVSSIVPPAEPRGGERRGRRSRPASSRRRRGSRLRTFALGMALALAVGIPLGYRHGARQGCRPDPLGLWVNIFASAPISALVPILMALVGIGEATVVVTVSCSRCS